MIHMKASRVKIYGVGQQAATRYKAQDGTVKQGVWTVADGKGGSLLPGYVLGITESPYGIAYAVYALVSNVTYDLTGVVVPAKSVIHLSRAEVDATPAELEASIIASIQSDADGAWSYEGLEGYDGTLYAWIKISGAILDALNAGISTSMEVTVHAGDDSDVVYAEQTAELDYPGGWPTITLHGTCPASAAQVRVSKHALLACPTCTCSTCSGSGTLVNHESCTNCGGTGKINKTCTTCNGAGKYKITCRDCGGDGIADIECPDCGGTGKVDDTACETCHGKGKVNGTESCATCNGTGEVDATCSTCSGTEIETISCSVCGGDGLMDVPCPDCGGDGIVGASPCPSCGGKRWITGPLTIDTLTPTVKATTAPADGSYSVTFDGEYHPNSRYDKYPKPPWPTWEYIVWCEANSGEITVSMTSTNNACLSGGTLITMADGSTKRLDEVRPGDLLLAGDGTPTRARRVARGQWNDHHTLYRFSDGTVIDEIHDHRFFCAEQGFWQLLRRWRIGDHARRQNGAEVALVSVERVDESAEMFGLWTESRDYWADGLLSGETAANQALLADATAEQAAEMMASLEERAILQLLGGLEDLMP